jgi:hypothetical protein
MNKYNFEFWRWHFNCDNFNQKHSSILLSIISNGRLGRYMTFGSYATITFDEEDTAHRYPTITELENFSRNKTNCLIFDLTENEKNQNVYDKLFIYHSNGSQHDFYGYVLYNTETKKMMHKYFVTHEYDELCIALTKTLNTLEKSSLYNLYSNRYDSSKNKNNNELLTKKDEEDFFAKYNEMLKKYL